MLDGPKHDYYVKPTPAKMLNGEPGAPVNYENPTVFSEAYETKTKCTDDDSYADRAVANGGTTETKDNSAITAVDLVECECDTDSLWVECVKKCVEKVTEEVKE